MGIVRRHPILAIAAALAVLAAALAVAGWYVVGEERRLARVVSGLLASRTGLDVTVDRASTAGARLTLTGLRIGPGAGFPLHVRARRLEIEGGLMLLVAPAGRSVSVTALGAAVAVPDGGAVALPDAATLDALRASARRLLGWPAALTLRVPGGEVSAGGRSYRFDLAGDKTGGEMTVTLGPGPAGGSRALEIAARAVADGTRALAVHVDAAGEPRGLGRLWPSALPAPARLAFRADLKLVAGGDVEASGRLTLAGASAEAAVVDFVSHYDARPATLSVSRFAVDWPPGLRLEGTARAEPEDGSLRMIAGATGSLDGSRLEGDLRYRAAAGSLNGNLTIEAVSLQKIWQRLGLGAAPVEATARTARASVQGILGGALAVGVQARAVEVAAARGFPVDAGLVATVVTGRSTSAAPIERVEAATLDLSRDGQPLAKITGRSSAGELWPLAVEATVADLGRVAPALPLKLALAGTARFEGEVRRGDAADAGDGLGIVGRLNARLPRVEVRSGAPVTVSDVLADIPVAWRARDDGRSGVVGFERLTAYGLTVSRMTSGARFSGGRLLLPDVHATHHGGRVDGWVEAAVDGRPVPLRAHLEGEGIDLAAIVRESGASVARATGRVKYVIGAQHSRGAGFVAAAHIESEQGGEIGIEAIQQLLQSPAVEVESTGLLRQTLENLRVFDYESLEADVRVSGGAGRADLSLRGKKRLGVFPGPVEAINLRNVPLALLARAMDKGISR